MADDLARWLEKLDLGKYAEIFAKHEVSVRDLPHLTEDDLKNLGLPLGPRRRLLAAVKSGDVVSAPAQAKQRIEEEVAPTLQKGSIGGAERRLLTIVFADLVESTELSRRLDPEDLREVLRRYHDAVAAVVRCYEGHIGKFRGRRRAGRPTRQPPLLCRRIGLLGLSFSPPGTSEHGGVFSAQPAHASRERASMSLSRDCERVRSKKRVCSICLLRAAEVR